MMANGRYFIGAATGVAAGALLMLFVGPWATSAQEARQNASNTLVQCEPSQQVVVRHVVVNNELQVSTQCVGETRGVAADYVSDGARPVYVASRPMTATRSVAAPVRVARTATAPVSVQRETEPKRSWQKTALVIGGSAGAGAGVGAIAGGKKGALIGAAIGGGAASIFEAIKRK